MRQIINSNTKTKEEWYMEKIVEIVIGVLGLLIAIPSAILTIQKIKKIWVKSTRLRGKMRCRKRG